MSFQSYFKEIERQYRLRLPQWMEDFEKTGNMKHDPYFIDWVIGFSPIESMVWNDIRGSGLPFYPQVPACGYFLDFACPMLKIAIECDGKDFHDKQKDAIRDSKLEADGWIVFRLTGSECNRLLPDPTSNEEYLEGADSYTISEWFNKTSHGVMYAIDQLFFKSDFSEFALENDGELYKTLHDHTSTPKTYFDRLDSILDSHD